MAGDLKQIEIKCRKSKCTGKNQPASLSIHCIKIACRWFWPFQGRFWNQI